jgi:hypothetical protein
MSTEWYYARNNQQFGPVSAPELKRLTLSGQLSPDDLVWRDGMGEWEPAAKVRGLFDNAPAAAPVAQAVAMPEHAYAPQPTAPQHSGQQYGQSAGPIGYYSATADIGARTAHTLRGFPSPTGPRGEWPLSDLHLAQLAQTEKHRKAIRAFNNLCHVLVLLCVIGVVTALAMLASAPGARAARNPVLMAGGVGLSVYLALGVLFYICGRAALKARIWGPITVCVLLTVGTVLWVLGAFVAMGSGGGRDQTGIAIALIFILLIVTALLWVNIRGIIAIPKFLSSPVWAQEALVNAKL